MTRMQLIRSLAALRPDLTTYRDLEAAYRISLKSLARRYLELHDEIADLDVMIAAIVDELVPDLVVVHRGTARRQPAGEPLTVQSVRGRAGLAFDTAGVQPAIAGHELKIMQE